jgi:Fanconi anemia group M protein
MSSVCIDCRETELVQQVSLLLGPDVLKIEPLHLGDILISDKLIIERKKWSDLACSIMDGRYKEQSHRLLQAKSEGYKIYYFLEGNLDLYKPYGISKDALRSCVYSLTYEKEFFVILTKSTKESAEYIVKFYEKINKEKRAVMPHSILTKKKNDQINKENISEYMLGQIPGISTTISRLLLDKYKSIGHIFAELENPMLFEEFTYIKDDKPKTLNKNTIVSLNHFLRK